MSVDNSELLMLLGGKGPGSGIGIAGQQGFGVGVYGGDPADLTAMRLAPMEGCEDPTSANYGNYLHTNGSIMCCIPAFCYRLGRETAPSYKHDAENALEIKDATKFSQFSHDAVFSSPDFGDGWILHRAFVDGNKLKIAFFIDKYLCSNVKSQAASVKNADWLMCHDDTTKPYFTKQIPGTSGQAYDAIMLSRARGDHYSLVTCYQWSAISLLSLAHGQAATSTDACAWYDATHTANFPKGATKGHGLDFDDDTIRYTEHYYGVGFSRTGAGTPFEKTTHNGQTNGVVDVAGMCNQWTIGARNPAQATVELMNTTVTAHEITQYTVLSQKLHTSYPTGFGNGQKSFNGIRNGTSGLDWAGAGIVPKATTLSSLFGADCYQESYNTTNGLKVGLSGAWGQEAGMFCRSWGGFSKPYWDYDSLYSGFRAAAYPP